jgi:benzaldehyde dehydrogenase (NAD)
VRAIATPLACGNTVIFKGSENYPRTHQLIVEAFQEAGFAPGVLNYITNAPADAGAVVEAVVSHPAVRRVNFTGSTKVGRIIAMTCTKYLKPVVLELGGKAPLVILDDADIEDAVNGATFGCFANSGQICMSTERIIVDQKIADEFVKKFAAKAGALPLGDPRKSEPVVLGSVIGMSTVQRLGHLPRQRARHRRVHRPALDHHPDHAAALSVLRRTAIGPIAIKIGAYYSLWKRLAAHRV